jgi:hypothetical protein
MAIAQIVQSYLDALVAILEEIISPDDGFASFGVTDK